MEIISVGIGSLGLDVMRNFRIGHNGKFQTGWERGFRNPVDQVGGDGIRRAASEKRRRRNGEVEFRNEVRISRSQTKIFVALFDLIIG